MEAARAGTESPIAAETILNGKEERINALNAQEYAAARSGAAPENLYNQINGENFSMTTYQTTIRESFFTTRNSNTGYDDLNVNGVKVRTCLLYTSVFFFVDKITFCAICSSII